jgi:hypothetical protein
MIQRSTQPALVGPGDTVRMLKRLPRKHVQFDEAYLQILLRDHPELLPVSEIRDDVGSLICIGREVPVASGSIDILYLSTAGYPVVVETKLWRNPQARREVLAQLLEYIKDLRCKDAAWFEAQWQSGRAGTGERGSQLWQRLIGLSGEELDEGDLFDRVNRALGRGEIIGMIVGDGIETRLQALVDDLCKDTPHLRYAMTLVELACFEHSALGDDQLLVVPRIVQNVEPVERAYIRIEMAPPLDRQLAVRPVIEADFTERTGSRVTLSEGDFLAAVEASAGRLCRDQVHEFYSDLVHSFELEPEFKAAAVMLKVPDATEGRPGVSVLAIEKEGRIYNPKFLSGQLSRWGVDRTEARQVAADYWATLHGIDVRFDTTGIEHLATSRFIPFMDLVAKLPSIKEATGKVVATIRQKGEESASDGASRE